MTYDHRFVDQKQNLRLCGDCRYLHVLTMNSPCRTCFRTNTKSKWESNIVKPKEQQEKNEPYPVTLIEVSL